MEILKTIWTALTTENQNLTLFFYTLLTFLEVYISTILFTSLLSIKATKKEKLIYMFSFSGIAIISMIAIPAPYNTFINLIACPILVYFIFKTNILKAIFAEIVPYIIFVILGSILLNMCVTISKIPTNIFVQIPIAKLTCSLLMYLVAYSLYKFFVHFSININITDSLKKKDKIILLINMLIGILALAIQSYLATIYSYYIPLTLTILNIFVLLVYFVFTMYSLARTIKLEETTASLEEERLYNKTLNILYDNIRGFKHDFGNIVQSIGGYISTNNMDGLKDYYNDLMKDCRKSNNLSILNPELVQNPAAYSLITSKYHKAEDMGISMEVEVFSNLADVNMKAYELTRVLGILLDNAIEASNKCNDIKKINLTIRKEAKLNRQLIVISNTYTNKDVNTDKIFEKGYTSKNDFDGKSHGLGLWEVRKILKKNNNLNLFTTKSGEFFTQQLEIYN